MSVESSDQGPNGWATLDAHTLNLKRCPHCTRYLALAHFSRQSGSPDGLQSWCKDCAHKHGQPPRKGTPARERYDQGLPPEGALEDPPPPKPKQVHDYHMAPLTPADIERLSVAITRVGLDAFLISADLSRSTIRLIQKGRAVARVTRERALYATREALLPPLTPEPPVAIAPATLPLPEPPAVVIPPQPTLSEEMQRVARAMENNGPLLEFLVDLEAYVRDQALRGVPLGALQLRYMAVWPPSGFRTLAVP